MTASLELFGARTGNCLRASIALEEAGLDYVARVVDLRHGQQYAPTHLALNPDGKVPVLIDRANPDAPFVLTQSNAIMFHAAERSGKLLPIGDPQARARVLEHYFHFLTDVIAPKHSAFLLRMYGGGKADGLGLLSRAEEMFAVSERFLADSEFMSGDMFGLADIAGYTTAMASEDIIDWAALPRLTRWYEAAKARPAVIRGLHAFDHAG